MYLYMNFFWQFEKYRSSVLKGERYRKEILKFDFLIIPLNTYVQYIVHLIGNRALTSGM
jgi:hypothetical protein